MSDNGVSASTECTTQWCEHVLQTYYTYLGRRRREGGGGRGGSSSSSSSTATTTSPGNSSGENDNGTSATENNSLGPGGAVADLVDVNVVGFEIGPGLSGDGKISTLSDLLSLSVKFRVR